MRCFVLSLWILTMWNVSTYTRSYGLCTTHVESQVYLPPGSPSIVQSLLLRRVEFFSYTNSVSMTTNKSIDPAASSGVWRYILMDMKEIGILCRASRERPNRTHV
ncbi:hypothetical protein BDZ94DRAFT_1266641 [Collybia nuda]|uniref:Secreted protein n=1 Tax=Collybia nuda TaxID=64659 RepID=A0A9P6CFG6_9AGAR|nr:hypothetical protein BDZ94DRAFT_1266641 [Collybia nuda]